MRFFKSINSFTTGRLSPRFHGRYDFKKLRSGLTELDNAIVQKQGGVKQPSGMKLVESTNLDLNSFHPTRILGTISFLNPEKERRDGLLLVTAHFRDFNSSYAVTFEFKIVDPF